MEMKVMLGGRVYRLLGVFGCICGMVVSLSTISRCQDRTPGTADSLAVILKGIDNNLDQVHSARGIYSWRKIVNADPVFKNSNNPAVPGKLYMWLMKGDSFREDVVSMQPDGSVGGVSITAVVGGHCYYWSPKSKYGTVYDPSKAKENGVISSEVSTWLNLAYRYVDHDRVFSHEVMSNSPVVKGKEVIGGSNCFRIEGISPKGTKHIWWVAYEEGFCIKRHEWQMELPNATDVSKYRWVDDATLSKVDNDIWLPSRIEQTCYATLGTDSKERWAWKNVFESHALNVNIPISDDQIRVVFPPDTNGNTGQNGTKE